MEREKLTDIWFVFRILEFEVNFGDFIFLLIFVCYHVVNFTVVQCHLPPPS